MYIFIKTVTTAAASFILTTFLAMSTATVALGQTEPVPVPLRDPETHVFDLHFGFDNAEDFLPLINLLDSAIEGDIIIIDINSPGGYVWIMSALTEAMDSSKAKTIAVVASGNMAASAGAFTACHADVIKVRKGGRVMLHLGTMQLTVGKYTPVQVFEQYREHLDHMYEELEPCKRFLEDEQVIDILKGEDVWINGPITVEEDE